MLNKQLEEAKSGKEDAFVAVMFRASAFLVTSQGTAFTCTTSYFMQECELVIQGPKWKKSPKLPFGEKWSPAVNL